MKGDFFIQSKNKITYQNYIVWWRYFNVFIQRKHRKTKKLSVLKETVENADLHKAELNKTMITQE